ncbi:hypothetical protein Hanom_Chr02g00118021 [Helianthus anomalus]
MYDATAVRLVSRRQVDDCYFSGVIYSMMAVVVGGFSDLRLQFLLCILVQDKCAVSLKAKIKAAHSYAFPDSSTLVALDE